MITVGIDDTDTKDTRGTNAVARALLGRLGMDERGARVIRHQLLDDPRVPYTTKNGSASIVIERASRADIPRLIKVIRETMLEWFIDGSDPGLCVAEEVPGEVKAFGRRCKRELIDQREARALAACHGIHLEGLGGTEGGVIGALAAVGLVTTGDDGRVVHLGGWPWPDDLSGVVSIETLHARGVEEIRVEVSGERISPDRVDIGKRLRPNFRGGRVVLFVEAAPSGWRALRPT